MPSLGSAVSAGWITFAVVLIFIFLLSWLYVRYYTHRRDRECSVTTVATLALTTVFLTNALIPVDIFLVSFMKDRDGHFKAWAKENTTRQSVEDSVLYAYYSLYGLVILFIFIIIPLAYFYHEEKDDDNPTLSVPARCLSSLKFAIIFIIIAGILLLIGAVIPLNTHSGSGNSTDSDFITLVQDLKASHIEDALSFTISCISLLGLLVWVLYSSFGMAFWPISLIRGRRSAAVEHLEVIDEREDNSERIKSIRDRYERHRPGSSRMSARDSEALANLVGSEHLLQRRQRYLAIASGHWTNRCLTILRPISFVFGLLFSLMSVLIYLALLLVNIDKALHSKYKDGYTLKKTSIPNPLDIALLFCQQVFPLDYILMSGIVLFLVCCTMSAISKIGIWCCCLRMYKLRPHRTRPQGVLLVILLLMLFALMLNIMTLALSPQYAMYGNQHYWSNGTATNSNTTNMQLKRCDTDAPSDVCTMTRLATLLLTYFYKAWFFGAAYYWGSWLIIAIFPFSVILSIVKRRNSAIAGYVEDSDFDSSDEEEEPLLRA